MNRSVDRRARLVLTFAAITATAVGTLGAVGPTQVSDAAVATSDPTDGAMVRALDQGVRVEDTTKRSEFGMVYANPDGTWTSEESVTPIFAQSGSGELEPVDPTLVASNGGYTTANTSYALEIPNGGTGTFARVGEGAEAFELTWPAQLPEPSIHGNVATYADVMPDADLVVVADPEGVSHHVVLHAPPDTGDLSIAIGLDTDLDLTKEPNDSLSLTAADGERVAGAATPTMWDSTEVPEALGVQVETDDAAPTTVTLTADAEYLHGAQTNYPVTIDPSFVLTDPGDATISTPSREIPRFQDPELRVGTNDGGATKHRALLKFSDASIPWVGKEIVSSSLQIRNFSAASCLGMPIQARRITEPWSLSNITWANQPGITSARQAIYTPAHGGPTCETAADATWDLTSMVQGWADQTYPNYGIKRPPVCRHDKRWYAYQPVHPRKDGGPDGAPEGMFMDLKNAERDGAGFNGGEPVYYRYRPYQMIHYWFHYGNSQVVVGPSGLPGSRHEGDWEHIAIKLN